MQPVPALVSLVLIAFWAYCLADLARTDERDVRTWPKEAWVVVLVLTNVAGGALWLVYGRPQRRQ